METAAPLWLELGQGGLFVTKTEGKKPETGVGHVLLMTEKGENVLWVEGRGWVPRHFSFYQG